MARKGQFSKTDYATAKKQLGYTGKLTKAKAQRVFKKAVKIARGGSSKVSKSTSKKSSPKKGGSGTAKKKKKRSNPFYFKVGIHGPILLSPFVPAKPGVSPPSEFVEAGDYKTAAIQWIDGWLPIDVYELTEGGGELRFDVPNYLLMTGAGALCSKLAGWLGINRALGRAKLPIRI